MIVFYVSGHGFGHASRDIEVLNAVLRRRPSISVAIRSAVPAWFLEASLKQRVTLEPLETDPGLAQHDSLRIDETETVLRARRFYDGFDERAEAEATWLRTCGTRLVVADVPPLACAAAARAGIPSILLGNFTWDWIYRGLDEFERLAPGVLSTIEQAYATTGQALRLPLHGGFAPMADVVRDIPFVARRSARGRDAVREALGIDADRPVVLASFGGHGVQIPYTEAVKDRRFVLLLTDFEVRGPDSHAGNTGGGVLEGVRCVSARERAERDLRYEDLVAAADVVVSKPGYGIVSECVANNTALLYTSRGRMIEYDVFVEEMPRLLRCRFIPQDALLAGAWTDHIDALMAQPPAPTVPPVNGAQVAADVILNSL